MSDPQHLFQIKNWATWGYEHHFFYYFTFQSHLLCVCVCVCVCVCAESKVPFIIFRIESFETKSFELAMQDSHPSLYFTKTWYQLYISDPFW